YMPDQQLGLSIGVKRMPWNFNISFSYQGSMFDQSVGENRKTIPGHSVLDGTIHYNYHKKGHIYLRMDNILDKSYIVSFRPFGARPGRPRSILAGITHRF
ncbi:MAG: TonB-dependent receptor, partial [Halobacteriovoraceae bacterium]|nr:TonB-dependent receptor [Halobacteriovoraceae bacterium]